MSAGRPKRLNASQLRWIYNMVTSKNPIQPICICAMDVSNDRYAHSTQIIAGLAKEWGHKKIPLFQTSNSRRADHRDLGTFSTWVKWAAPTAEAPRQACLAQESRVSQTPPLLPFIGITAISVSGARPRPRPQRSRARRERVRQVWGTSGASTQRSPLFAGLSAGRRG